MEFVGAAQSSVDGSIGVELSNGFVLTDADVVTVTGTVFADGVGVVLGDISLSLSQLSAMTEFEVNGSGTTGVDLLGGIILPEVGSSGIVGSSSGGTSCVPVDLSGGSLLLQGVGEFSILANGACSSNTGVDLSGVSISSAGGKYSHLPFYWCASDESGRDRNSDSRDGWKGPFRGLWHCRYQCSQSTDG